jgi:hypothetical protein
MMSLPHKKLVSLIAIGLVSASLSGAQAVASDNVFFDDFESSTPPLVGVWSDRSLNITPDDDRHFLGQFSGNEAATLFWNNLSAHDSIDLSFDLFIIRDWDGDEVYAANDTPDQWQLTFDGRTLVSQSFSNNINPQSYPVAPSLTQTGAVETGTLGYFYPGHGRSDAVYHFEFSEPHTADSLLIEFSGIDVGALGEESWGIDNVMVSFVPEPSSMSLLVIGLGAMMTHRRRNNRRRRGTRL